MQRLKHILIMFDLVRIDHFRGLINYWQIPATHRTAMHGRWVNGPGQHFFDALLRHFPTAPIIAEDLGYITAEVRETINKLQFPSMKVLQFAFDACTCGCAGTGGDAASNPYIPHNHIENCVVYTGTHDNNTVRGWFEGEANRTQKKRLFDYLGRKVPASKIHWEFIRLAMSSVAKISIIPMQDILGLAGSARMNRPASRRGNWLWRLQPGQLTPAVSRKLKHLTHIYARD
jgi:4-alpha-glucanotransferase